MLEDIYKAPTTVFTKHLQNLYKTNKMFCYDPSNILNSLKTFINTVSLFFDRFKRKARDEKNAIQKEKSYACHKSNLPLSKTSSKAF